MEYTRLLPLAELLRRKSFFLFGPRAVGKTFLLRRIFPEARVYNLLHAPTLSALSKNPLLIGQETSDTSSIIVIDEIQKLPSLLDEVHRLIEERNLRFLLTGSSARKPRKGGVNLLAGRAWEARLFPLVSAEIPNFELERFLLLGGLPPVVLSNDPWEELQAYTGTYLETEIRAEAAVANLGTFATFLDIAATKVGEELNYHSLASDLGVSPPTVQNYFQLLEDTLLGFRLHPFRRTLKRKSTSHPKFYFFDLGVTNSLLGYRALPPRSEEFGRAFEQFIALEIRAYLSYRRLQQPLTFWRSQSGFEVDFLIGDEIAIEAKSATAVPERSLKGLQALAEENVVRERYVVSQETHPRTVHGIHILPWKEFLARLWSDSLLPR
jgi:uncharacterized protein